jgi:AAA15 family ATPase/GTPase
MSSEDLKKNLENLTLKRLKDDFLLILLSLEISRHNVIMKFNTRGFKKYPVVFNKMMYSIEELHDMVIKNKYIENDINDIIKFIKEKIFYIEDIRRIKEGIYVKTSNENEYMPLSTMGDGFKALLKMSFTIALAKDGIVILEEPENSLHPGFLDIVAKTLVKNSDSVQLFLSTHSLEFLYEILEKAEESKKLNEVNIIRTHRKRYKPDDVIIEVVDGKEAKERIDDIGEDLRLG